ncbi:MAG TPA: ATP-binding cassette domain-containing protein [Balneolaceae bacterium]|nr:ATP-binding cassette domain-containing protein [Balneolaceae bacterium]
MSTIIEVQNLRKKYDDVEALKGIGLSVEEGEIFALLGPNGAGKTTLFSILATLRKPTSGKAVVLGKDVLKYREEIRQQIGIVFQEPALDERLSARDNLMLMALFYGISRKEAKKRANEVLDLLDINDFADRASRKLSGGQKRKLELARAIIAEPKLLFLDEATLGLDVDARRNFWDEVKKLSEKGSTIFLTTHYMEEAEVADRIALIDEGNIIAVDTPRSLKEQVGGGLIRLDTEDNESVLHWLKQQDLEAENSNEGLFIVSNDPSGLLPTILSHIEQKVTRAEIRQPSLEDVFLKLTGRSLKNGENEEIESVKNEWVK